MEHYTETLLAEEGFTNLRPLDPEKWRRLNDKVKAFSRTLKISTPEIIVGDTGFKNAHAVTTTDKTGDFIILNTFMLENFTQNEVIAALGHELIHQYKPKGSLRTALYMGATAGAAGGVALGYASTSLITREDFLKKTGALFGAFSGAVGTVLKSSSIHGQRAENEADLLSAEIFGTADDLISFLQKIKKFNETMYEKMGPVTSTLNKLNIFSDHPSEDDRINSLQELKARLKAQASATR